jgi:kanamycin kinase
VGVDRRRGGNHLQLLTEAESVRSGIGGPHRVDSVDGDAAVSPPHEATECLLGEQVFDYRLESRLPVLCRSSSRRSGTLGRSPIQLSSLAALDPHTIDEVSDPDFSHLAELHALGSGEIPPPVLEIAGGLDVELAWRNELGGLTFRCADRFVKWNPRSTGIDLRRERDRLDWIAARHPAPRVIDWGEDESTQWMVTAALPGDCAVGDDWRARRSEAISAIASGLRAIHAVSTVDFPQEWTAQVWISQRPESLGKAPPTDRPVLVHGDACAPNTLISPAGEWVGNVDFGDLAVGDAWADLAVASLSLDWNFGKGHQHEFFNAYGVEPDEERIRYYRALWQLAS